MKKQILIMALAGSMVAYGEDPKLGETWYVSTAKLTLRAKPDALSKAVKELKYKDAAKVKGVSRVAVPFDGDKDKFPDTLMPNWVKVEAGGETGYLPVSSLASEWLIENQNPDEIVSSDGKMTAKRGFSESENGAELTAMRGFSESENGDLVAMRGFSETENGDLAAMRGAAGQGKTAATVDPAAVAKMLASRKQPTDAAVAAFVANGKLKDDDVRKTTELAVEEEGFFGGLMKSTRKVSAGGLGFASKLTKAVAGDDKLLGAAASAGKLTSGMIYSEIGPVQEYQLGLAIAARILPLYPLVSAKDKTAQYVAELGATLAAASNDPMPYNGYSFMLIRSDEVNAFAVPGGFVFITTGMLKFLKNEDELAAILGHEMGHMELRHGMSSVGKENVLKLFSLAKEVGTTMATGDKQSLAINELKALSDLIFNKMLTAIRNGYGIDMESQADWRSVQFLKTLGYDTKSLYNVLERFKEEKGTYGGASYPEERGADVLKYMKDFDCDDDASGVDLRTARYKEAVGK